jgi:hypothetical protein
MPGGEVAAVAYVTITSLVIAAATVLFIWPEIPNPPEEWSYTGPLLGIVVLALAVGEAIIWRMAHPRAPRAARSGPARQPGSERQPGAAQPAAGGQ